MRKIIMVFMALVLVAGCMTIYRDWTRKPQFKEVLAKTYQTADDFVLTQSQDSKEIMVEKFGQQGVPSREEVNNKKIPFKYYGDTIHGVLPKGTLFKVVKVTYMNNFETRQIYYAAEILSDGPFKGKTIDVSLLTDGSEVPKFLEKYAVEVKP